MKFIKALLFFSLFLLFPGVVSAQETSCQNRAVTFVNPVRGRNLWGDKSISPLQKQYAVLAGHNYPATWLLQYDALTDKEIVDAIKNFSIKGETGVFLEVSRSLGEDAGVATPLYLRWSDPGSVFLSAYSQSERKELIDEIYSRFKVTFGYYPKSVGAWWIDSYSLSYIKNKYGLEAIMIVADQKTTDSYGVWGQLWGVPYYPSKENVLVPGVGNNNLGPVVIQWAQRDPELAYGEGPSFSNFSLQANDYIRSRKNTSYFVSVANKYLDCRNEIGQITVGLETGMESSEFLNEYTNQIKVLSKNPELKALTMSSFAKVFKSVYSENPQQFKIGGWIMTPNYRENAKLHDRVNYVQGISFADFFVSDKESFLNRNLSSIESLGVQTYYPVFLIVFLVFAFILIMKKKIEILMWSLLFGTAAFGLIFRSNFQYGWQVYYGPSFNNLIAAQTILTVLVLSFGLLLFSKKLKLPKLFLWLIPLSYSLDWLLSFVRYTKIQGSTYLGILVSKVYFWGVSFGKSIDIIHTKYSPNVASAFLRIPFDEVYAGNLIGVILFSLLHVFVAFGLYLLLRKIPGKSRKWIIIILSVILVFEIISIFQTDPRAVIPVI